MKLVKFSDGTFGIRTRIWPAQFMDFDTPQYSWGKWSTNFHYCCVTEEEARKAFKQQHLRYVVIE